MHTENATEIVQDFLDRQGAVTMAGDIDATLSWCDIPCTLETPAAKVVASTSFEMRRICEVFVRTLREKQLTHLVRRCLDAKFKGPDRIWATYETRYVRTGYELAEEPYMSFLILHATPDRWKIGTIQFLVSGSNPVNVTLNYWIDLLELSGKG